MEKIKYEDFEKVEIRVWEIVEVIDLIWTKKPWYLIKIDFGENIWVKTSISCQLIDLYNHKDLIWKQVVGILNFEPKQIWKYISEVLVTGFTNNANKVVLISPDTKVQNGQKLF